MHRVHCRTITCNISFFRTYVNLNSLTTSKQCNMITISNNTIMWWTFIHVRAKRYWFEMQGVIYKIFWKYRGVLWINAAMTKKNWIRISQVSFFLNKFQAEVEPNNSKHYLNEIRFNLTDHVDILSNSNLFSPSCTLC
jgi:hypothetical protein